MTALALTRKQRLRSLEKEISDLAESITTNGIEIGMRLCEIRDDELWRDDYESWNQYLKQHAETLVSKSFSQAKLLIRAAEVSKRLPRRLIDKPTLSPSHLREIARLAPVVGKESGGAETDYSQLRKQDIQRVLKKAAEFAGSDSQTVRDIRKAIDHDLGVERTKPKPAEQDYNTDPNALPNYLRSRIGMIEGIIENLAKLPDEAWQELANDDPHLAARFSTVCYELAELSR